MTDKKLTYTSAKDGSVMYGTLQGHVKMFHYDEIINKMVRMECIWCEGLVGIVKVETKESDDPQCRILSICSKCVRSYESSVKKLKPKDLADKEQLV